MVLCDIGDGMGFAIVRRFALTACLATTALFGCTVVHAQTATAAAATRALGTVTDIQAGTLTIKTDAGATVTATLGSNVRVQQLAPGSTDLKTAEAATPDAIAAGDRVLVSGSAADGNGLTATRVILMKSTAIAQRNQSTQADWGRRGTGGIVTAVDPVTGTISLSAGTRKLTLDTTKSTAFRRYAPGSVKFEDARPGTLADIHPGDQVRARGDRSADGTTVTAEEVVSGSFRNLSGTVASINPGTNSFVIKDLATKKNETVTVGPDSDLRSLPPEMAARFAPNRTAKAGSGAAGAGAADGTAHPGQGGGEGASRANGQGTGYGGGGRGPGSGARTGADLSAMIPRLPKTALADWKPGEALMIVASGNSGGPYTAITVLSGVEPLLTGPAGSEITLPPWSSAGGGGEAAGTE